MTWGGESFPDSTVSHHGPPGGHLGRVFDVMRTAGGAVAVRSLPSVPPTNHPITGGAVVTFVGCDLHSRSQQVAVLNTDTGELQEQRLAHEGQAVEQFYRALPRPVTIG